MNTYIARQPIFDKSLKISAYELLFRSGGSTGSFSGVDENLATSRTIIESFQTVGLETITNGKPAFINFTSSLLLEDIATLFPKNLLMVEVLENIAPTPKIVAACAELRAKGYTLALDDFVYRPELEPLIELSSVIKFDFLASSQREIVAMLRRMNVEGKTLLAEKIETQRMFNVAANMGFDLFQGYFFSKPVTVSSRSLAPLKINYLSLLREMKAGSEMDFDKIANTIRHDVALCHKLLRMVNSAYYGMRSQVTDIKRALAILGTKEVRKWVYLLTLMDLSSKKPDELIRMSLIRGFFMEQTSRWVCGFAKDSMFLTGMFSLIDVLIDQPMQTALANMALSPDVCEALILRRGKLYELLQLVVSLENGQWAEVDRLALSLGIDAKEVSDKYLLAVRYCDGILA